MPRHHIICEVRVFAVCAKTPDAAHLCIPMCLQEAPLPLAVIDVPDTHCPTLVRRDNHMERVVIQAAPHLHEGK